MNPDVKDAWLLALRSGRYQQGQETLRTEDDKYCCLGVLCDLAVGAGVASWVRAETNGALSGWYAASFSRGSASMGTLPRAVWEWAGLEDGNPDLDGQSAACWNDSEGASFGEIADLIEEFL